MDNIYQLMLQEQQKAELKKIVDSNEKTRAFGLTLSEEQAKELLVSRKNSLADTQRVEFGGSILPKLIHAFCDSQFIEQDNYLMVLTELQEIFYTYKNESMDDLTDDELLDFMRRQFDEVCFGDLDYLKGTCLERFTRAIRSGYRSSYQKRLRDEYSLRKEDNEYTKFSEEATWDYELYKLKLEDEF